MLWSYVTKIDLAGLIMHHTLSNNKNEAFKSDRTVNLGGDNVIIWISF